MPKKGYPIKLSEEERHQLQYYVKQGKKSARAITRARLLLLANEQQSDEELSAVLGVSRTTGYRVRKEDNEIGLQHTLPERPRRGAPSKIDSRVEATLTMLACADPPEGSGRWTLPLLADKLIAFGLVESSSLPTVRTARKKTH